MLRFLPWLRSFIWKTKHVLAKCVSILLLVFAQKVKHSLKLKYIKQGHICILFKIIAQTSRRRREKHKTFSAFMRKLGGKYWNGKVGEKKILLGFSSWFSPPFIKKAFPLFWKIYTPDTYQTNKKSDLAGLQLNFFNLSSFFRSIFLLDNLPQWDLIIYF